MLLQYLMLTEYVARHLELQEDDLREMLPVIGDRVHIRKLLDSLKQVKLHFYVSLIVRFFSQGVMPNLSVRPVVVSLPSPSNSSSQRLRDSTTLQSQVTSNNVTSAHNIHVSGF